MGETEKPKAESIIPPTVPIRGINVPDPTTGSDLESTEAGDGTTAHETFEKVESESAQRK